MATRQIIEIDEAACTGCGACETGCPEGALRIIDGKARLVGESLCDGLGACIGNCPFGAIKIIEREAEEYREEKVIELIVAQGPAVVAAHFEHLERHGQDLYLRQAEAWMKEHGYQVPASAASPDGGCHGSGCPGSRERSFRTKSFSPSRPALHSGRTENPVHPAVPASPPMETTLSSRKDEEPDSPQPEASALSHWPIQLHLINPRSRAYNGTHTLIAADCTAFALGSFHPKLLAGRSLVIACPKLDSGKELYIEKLAVLLESAAEVTVAIMEVPCCSGLLKLVLEARQRLAAHKVISVVILGIEGGIVAEKRY